MNNIRLLLVDDEDDFRSTVAKRLTKRGIALEEAGTGEECLAILEKTPMDVVILDVRCPAWTGSKPFIISRKNILKRRL